MDAIRAYIISNLTEADGVYYGAVENVADDVMDMLRRVCTNEDTYNLFVGYLNNLRLEMQEERDGKNRPSDGGPS